MAFAGVKNMKAVSQEILLSELGMDPTTSVEIRQVLERDFDIFLTGRDIYNLNFAKLAEMQVKDVGTEEQDRKQEAEVSGMQLLIRIPHDENINPEVCVELPTRKDPRKMDVFLLPGIEGCAHIFESLSSKIRPRTVCLQYGANNIKHDITSIPDYAKYFLPVRAQRRVYSISSMFDITLILLIVGTFSMFYQQWKRKECSF